jgi:anti-sigma regulatory factor (Ser/Thr protein kinase)
VLVSELVTNCVIHAGCGSDDEIAIAVHTDDIPRILLANKGSYTLAEAARTRPRPPGGLGLFLVD